MFFLLRAAFWLTIVLALLPTGSSQPAAKGPQVGAVDAMVAAGAAVSDMSSFCNRQAEACVVGTQTAVAIGQRAQAGAKMVYEFINDKVVRSDTGSLPEPKAVAAKGSEAKVVPAPKGSQSTLKPADLAPAWHSPPPRKEALPGKDGKRPT